jgi:hypothetical protein
LETIGPVQSFDLTENQTCNVVIISWLGSLTVTNVVNRNVGLLCDNSIITIEQYV